MKRLGLVITSALAVVLLTGCTTVSDVDKVSKEERSKPVLGIQRAKGLPLADTHFHPSLFMSPQELMERMDRFRSSWYVDTGACGEGYDRGTGPTPAGKVPESLLRSLLQKPPSGKGFPLHVCADYLFEIWDQGRLEATD